MPVGHSLTTCPPPGDKERNTHPHLKCLTTQDTFENSILTPFSSLSLLFPPNPSTHLKHQISRRLMSQPPPPERVVLGDCTLISYTLAQTEKELCGAEMLLLLAKLIHLHATLSPWQFHNKSREMPIEGPGSVLTLCRRRALACQFRHSESFRVQQPRFILDELKGHLTRHPTQYMSGSSSPPRCR